MSLLETEKCFLECQKEKKREREGKKTRKKEEQEKGEKIPTGHISKEKTEGFVYQPQADGKQGEKMERLLVREADAKRDQGQERRCPLLPLRLNPGAC